MDISCLGWHETHIPLFLYDLLLSPHLCMVPLCREVEDFARRLNSDWPERMQEILSLGQQGRLVPISINGNGSAHRYTSMSFF